MKEACEELRRIRFQGPEFPEWLALRELVLRKPLGLSFSPEEISAEAGQIHLACFRDGKVTGGLILQQCPGSPLIYHMRQVAVSPELQGQGIGQRLVEFAENFALEQNADSIILHAREPVVSFYEKLGYRTEGDSFEEVGIPHRKMSKNFRLTE